ncbi:hypothetical protein BDV96DRAFT_186144 [Lophiotrema nucula]|uniref:Secreted protein n=1 Tax=Lophiotrema nucula TaxID=690887 RepID=A0A6A5YVG8_9PLEO|nr:hypothetical protein BDV96DRAFT_186144 [Lophiotrema nucula]
MHLDNLFIPLLSFISLASAACKCKPVSNPGLYCGYCSAVLSGDDGNAPNWEYAFECNKEGGCYQYGRSSKCYNSNPDIYCNGCDAWATCKPDNLIKRDGDGVTG